MTRDEFKDLKVLCRKSNRTILERERMFFYIQQLTREAVSDDEKLSRRSIEYLTWVCNPKIKKVAGYVYKQSAAFLEYEDVLQETYLNFLSLIRKYDESRSSFLYFISYNLPAYMSIWKQKMRPDKVVGGKTFMEVALDSETQEAILCPTFDLSESDDVFIGIMFQKAYIEFIQERSERPSRSGTLKTVCEDFFLGHKTCTEIAKECNISYHAVYDIIQKIKVELLEHIKNCAYSNPSHDEDYDA